MRKLVVGTFVTLDGVMQNPGGAEEDPGDEFRQGGWQFPYADDDMGRLVDEWLAAADAFLLGRRTYEVGMSAYQQTRDCGALPVYEFTDEFAQLEPPPPEMQQLFAAIHGNQNAMDACRYRAMRWEYLHRTQRQPSETSRTAT